MELSFSTYIGACKILAKESEVAVEDMEPICTKHQSSYFYS